MIVSKRYPGERHYITEFVQPGTASVVELAARIANMPGDFAMNCLRWVKQRIQYPSGPGGTECVDWHYYEAFRVFDEDGQRKVLAQRWATDFWQFPAETLSLKMGDCEDGSILLCSLLRTRVSEEDVFVTVGRHQWEGHAWVTYLGNVLETSPCGGDGLYKEVYPYAPNYRFNDILVR
jgi:transglutaminase-like putative cysteine protease